ncbi:P2Y purinoceptor [Pimephales promelas]|nr:P2Y purinoceptor [Pimephales promelas]
MGKVFLFVLITFILLNATEAKGKRDKRQKGKRNTTDKASPRFFQGIANPVNLPLSPNQTTDLQAFVVPSVEVELRSNNTEKYLRGPLSKCFIPVVYIIAIVVGIPANIAILVAVEPNGNHWIFGETACRITTACFYGNLYCSTFTLACISIKRYIAVVHPFLYKSLPKRTFTTCGCVTIWIVFIIALLPEFLVQQSYRITQLGIITCHDVLPDNIYYYQWLVYYNLGLTCVGFFLPLVVTVACYTSIVWHLNRSHQDWALYIRASTFNFVIFGLCFGPSSCFHFVHYVLLSVSNTESFYIYFSVAVCLCCLHSALDPFLFMLMSRTVGTKRYFLGRKGHALSIST